MKMKITSSMSAAASKMEISLAAGRNIFYIKSDRFEKVLLLTELSYFQRYQQGNPVRIEDYIRVDAAQDEAFEEKERKQRVFYANLNDSDQSEGLSQSVTTRLTAFVEKNALRRMKQDAADSQLEIFVLYGTAVKLPAFLASLVEYITFPPLTTQDISLLLTENQDTMLTPQELNRHALWYARQLGSMDEMEIRDLLSAVKKMSATDQCYNYKLVEKVIRQRKQSLLEIHDKLTIKEPERITFSGYQNVKNWLRAHKKAILNVDQYGPVKGILLLGITGTGKSMIAKYTADFLELPLVQLEMSRILSKYVGESEQAMRYVQEDLNTIAAPCVLWIDEIEKALSGANGKGDGTGVMTRLLGMLLTFMQESKKSVFIVATANSIENLPAELFRSGRFSAIFTLMMPRYTECQDIMGGYLDGKTPHREKLLEICTGTEKENTALRFLTGANIDQICQEFLRIKEETENSLGRELNKAEECNIMRKICTFVLPHGSSNKRTRMMKIAKCYYDVLSENMLMADGTEIPSDFIEFYTSSGKNTHKPLFDSNQFHPERIIEFDYSQSSGACPTSMDLSKGLKGNSSAQERYDRGLFEAIREYVDLIIAEKEGITREYLMYKLNVNDK